MKNKKKVYYSKFRNKLLLRVMAVTSLSLVILIFLIKFFRDKFLHTIIKNLQKNFHLNNNDISAIFGLIFHDKLIILFSLTVLIVFAIGFFFIIFWITKYFNEISNGMDILIKQTDNTISLSPELSFMEAKLNDCKNIIKKRQYDAQIAEQRKNELVIYLAHDIKTPLTSIIGYLSLLDESPNMPLEQKAKYVNITLEKACRLEKLINEFFEITRYNLQQIKLQKETIHLYYMLVQMTEEFYPLLTPYNKKILLLADENITIHADPNKLARVFNNILKNAIAYSSDGSTIEISAKTFKGKIIIKFKNFGKTIPQRKLMSIFNKFYRIDESRATETGSSGLGLAIAKEIVTLHGGSIYAESQNSYTTFTVELPIINV